MACEELQAASPRPQIAKAKVRSNFMSTFRCSGDARRLAVFQKTSFPGFLGAQLGVGVSISAVCGAPTTDVSILSARSRRPLLAAARTARVVPHRALPDLLRMKHSAPILDTTSIATRAPTCRLRPGASRPGRSGRWFPWKPPFNLLSGGQRRHQGPAPTGWGPLAVLGVQGGQRRRGVKFPSRP